MGKIITLGILRNVNFFVRIISCDRLTFVAFIGQEISIDFKVDLPRHCCAHYRVLN